MTFLVVALLTDVWWNWRVPAGSARGFTLIFDVPPGQPLQFEYRGFNVKSELVKVR